MLGADTTPGIQYIPALIIKAHETFCFYGNRIQIIDAAYEYERLKSELDSYHEGLPSKKAISSANKFLLPQIPKLHLSSKPTTSKNDVIVELAEQAEQQDK